MRLHLSLVYRIPKISRGEPRRARNYTKRFSERGLGEGHSSRFELGYERSEIELGEGEKKKRRRTPLARARRHFAMVVDTYM